MSPMVASLGARKSAQYAATESSSATPSVARACAPILFVSIACAADAIFNSDARGFLNARVLSLLQQIFAEKPGHGQKYSIKRGQDSHPNCGQCGRIVKQARSRFGAGHQGRGQQRQEQKREQRFGGARLRSNRREDEAYDRELYS